MCTLGAFDAPRSRLHRSHLTKNYLPSLTGHRQPRIQIFHFVLLKKGAGKQKKKKPFLFPPGCNYCRLDQANLIHVKQFSKAAPTGCQPGSPASYPSAAHVAGEEQPGCQEGGASSYAVAALSPTQPDLFLFPFRHLLFLPPRGEELDQAVPTVVHGGHPCAP